MTFCNVKVDELKRAVGAKKLGMYPAVPGWNYNGKVVEQVEFERNGKARYFGNGECLGVFQDTATLDD